MQLNRTQLLSNYQHHQSVFPSLGEGSFTHEYPRSNPTSRRSSLRKLCVLCISPVLLLDRQADADELWQAAVPADVLEDYQHYLRGRNPLSVEDFGGPFARRDVVEVVLLQQALKLGKWLDSVVLTPMPSAARMRKEIELGNAICGATSFWRDDAREGNFLLSAPLINKGEFEVGLYTAESNSRALRAKTLEDVRKLTALSNHDWTVDWHTLEQLRITNRLHTWTWDSMPRMVEAGRADFLLAPFQPTRDLSLTVGSVRLVPIPNIKITLDGTRHFLISPTHPHSHALLDKLNAGLSHLHSHGTIRKAYTQAGFYNSHVANWTRLSVADQPS